MRPVSRTILGTVVSTAPMWGNTVTTALTIAPSFVFGYSLTLLAVIRASPDLKPAIRVAPAADTVSTAVMELMELMELFDNAIAALTRGRNARPSARRALPVGPARRVRGHLPDRRTVRTRPGHLLP